MNFKEQNGLLVPAHKLILQGKYHGQIIREGRVIDEWEDTNLVVNEGLNAALNVLLNAGAGYSAWYLGIFSGNYTPVATDGAAVIAANSGECSSYTSATRPQWNQAAPSSQSITNSANQASFTFNASVTVYGGFLISSAVIGGTGGTMFSAARFSTAKNVVNLDQMLLTYTLSAASA